MRNKKGFTLIELLSVIIIISIFIAIAVGFFGATLNKRNAIGNEPKPDKVIEEMYDKDEEKTL